MYWWRVSKLAEDLREGRVGEKERFKYCLAMLLLSTVMTRPFLWYGRPFEITEVIDAAIIATVVCIGTILCYRANRSGDNTDFIGRMICLAWPIGIRLLALAAVIGLAIYPLVRLSFSVGTTVGYPWEQIEKAVNVEEFVCRLAFEILYYWLLYKYMKLVAQPKEAQ